MFNHQKHQFWTLSTLCVVGALLLMGCSKESNDKEKAAKTGTLTMGTSADLPPFEFYRTNGTQTDIVGFDIDVAKAIGNHINKEVRIQDMDFASLIAALKAGRVDFVMASMTPTEERQKSVDFSIIYLRLPTTIVTKKGVTIKGPAELKNHKVGVQLGSSHAEVLDKFKQKEPTIKGVALNKVGDLVQELLAGRITAIVMESKAGEAFAQNNPDLQVNIIKDYDVTFAIAFAQGSPHRDQFNKALEHLKTQGTLEQLKEKWFSTPAE